MKFRCDGWIRANLIRDFGTTQAIGDINDDVYGLHLSFVFLQAAKLDWNVSGSLVNLHSEPKAMIWLLLGCGEAWLRTSEVQKADPCYFCTKSWVSTLSAGKNCRNVPSSDQWLSQLHFRLIICIDGLPFDAIFLMLSNSTLCRQSPRDWSLLRLTLHHNNFIKTQL